MTATAFAKGWDGVAPAQAGWLGLLVILLLGVSVVFLYKSLNKQLKKIPPSFDESADGNEETENSTPPSPRRFDA
jgi:hypothetical protein